MAVPTPTAMNAALDTFTTELSGRWKQRPGRSSFHEPCLTGAPWFYNTPRIRKWMLQSTGEHGPKNVELLLQSQTFLEPPLRNWDPNSIFNDDDKQECILVFSCLLSMNLGKWLYYFQSAGYDDSNLGDPDDITTERKLNKFSNTAPYTMSSAELKRQIRPLIEEFDERRWRFCPVPFDDKRLWNEGLDCHRNLIMPFCARLRRNSKGGTATVDQVAVQEEFVSRAMKEHLGPPFPFREYGMCYELVIKTYPKSLFEIYENELTAFNALREKSRVIRCFGSYSAIDEKDEKTYNIVLECGKMDLYQFYKEKAPPRTSHEIIARWKLLCEVAKVMQDMHEIFHKNVSYHGWHGDIKPDNILLVGTELKLADFGFAEFRKHGGTNSSLRKGGTETYGPPECKEADRRFDIWSFGCVLSVHATWVVAGYDGVTAFEMWRNVANRTKGMRENSDAFHDGKEVLQEIRDWHGFLRGIMRQSDNVTSNILDLVEKDMLRSTLADRLDATELCRQLKKTLGEAETKLHNALSTNKNTMTAFHSVARLREISTDNGEESHSSYIIRFEDHGRLLSMKRSNSGLHSYRSSRVEGFQAPANTNIKEVVMSLGDDTVTSNTGEPWDYPSTPSDQREPSQSGQNKPNGTSPVESDRYGNPDGIAKGKGKQNAIRPTTSLPSLDQRPPAQTSSSKTNKQLQMSDDAIVSTPRTSAYYAATAPASRAPQPVMPSITVNSSKCGPNTGLEPTDPAPDPVVNSAGPFESRSTSQQYSPATDNRLNQTPSAFVPQQPEPNPTPPGHGIVYTEAMKLAHGLKFEQLQPLLEVDGNISAQDLDGNTFLHYLVKALTSDPMELDEPFSRILKSLKPSDHGVLNQPDKRNRTPLYYAKGKPYVAKVLIKNGAKVDKDSFLRVAKDGPAPLMKVYLKEGYKYRTEMEGWFKQLKRPHEDVRKVLEAEFPKLPELELKLSKWVFLRN